MENNENFDFIGFAIYLHKEREAAEFMCEAQVNCAIANNVDRWIASSGLDKKKFINDAQSMVTPFMFQTPYMVLNSDWKRVLYREAFLDWNPNKWVLMFCSRIELVFENL